MFSQDERRQLDELERRLEASDPELAKMLGDFPREQKIHCGQFAAIVLDLLAFLFIALGAITLNMLLIFAGVMVAVGGACLHVTRRRRAREG